MVGEAIGLAGEVSNEAGFTLTLDRLDTPTTRLDPIPF